MCTKILSNECDCLAQGDIHGMRNIYAIDYIQCREVSRGRDVTNAIYELDHIPFKQEQFRVQIAVGGVFLYLDDAESPVANLMETKFLINIVISDASGYQLGYYDTI